MADILDDSAVGGDAASQRRSGRVVRAPAKFQQEIAAPTKRKRTGAASGDDDDNEVGGQDDDALEDDDGADGLDDEDDDDAQDSDDDDDDDGEANARRARPKRKANGTTAKRATKKPKLNGAGNSHAASLPSRPKKSVRVTIETDDHGSALYGESGAGGDAAVPLETKRREMSLTLFSFFSSFAPTDSRHLLVWRRQRRRGRALVRAVSGQQPGSCGRSGQLHPVGGRLRPPCDGGRH